MSSKEKFVIVLIWLAAAFCLVFSVNFYYNAKPVTISFIDVGQGDSCLIQGGRDGVILIDGGDEGSGYNLSTYLRLKNIRVINGAFISHFHSDHSAGIAELIEDGFEIQKIYISIEEKSSDLRYEFMTLASEHDIPVHWIRQGDILSIGKLDYYVLAPGKDTVQMKHNDQSAVIKAVYGASSVLFTGDAEIKEQYILTATDGLKSTILKMPHHGSKSAFNASFLKACDPDYAVISVGLDNKYGCPSETVTEYLTQHRIPFWRTDFDGTIEFVIDESGVRNITKTNKRR